MIKAGRRLWLPVVWLLLMAPGKGLAEVDDGIFAVFETTMGSFTSRLDFVRAPRTTANFISLAEGTRPWADPETGGAVEEPFYDGLLFHRVIAGFMIQGGCPLGTGLGGPGYVFRDEFHPELRHDGAGVLSMANSGPASNGSQFFITLDDTSWLDDRHSVFGRVIAGQDVVEAIGNVAVDGSRPVVDVNLQTVRIMRVGAEAEAFDERAWDLPAVGHAPLLLSLSAGAPALEFVRQPDTDYRLHRIAALDALPWEAYPLGFGRLPAAPEFLSGQALPGSGEPQSFYTVSATAYADATTPHDLQDYILTVQMPPEWAAKYEASLFRFIPDGAGGWLWEDDYPDAGHLVYHDWWPEPYLVHFLMEFNYYYPPLWQRLVFKDDLSGIARITVYDNPPYQLEGTFFVEPYIPPDP